MAFLLVREIKAPQKWIEPRRWPPDPDLPADRLVDLKTSSNELSVFACKADSIESEFLRLAVALTAKRDGAVRDFSCIVVPFERVVDAGFDVVHTPKSGQSAEDDVNKTHHDIRKITARRLVDLLGLLTPSIQDDGLPQQRSVPSLVLAKRLREGEKEQRFQLPDKLRASVDELLAEPS